MANVMATFAQFSDALSANGLAQPSSGCGLAVQ
jgi:hypothetical protein